MNESLLNLQTIDADNLKRKFLIISTSDLTTKSATDLQNFANNNPDALGKVNIQHIPFLNISPDLYSDSDYLSDNIFYYADIVFLLLENSETLRQFSQIDAFLKRKDILAIACVSENSTDTPQSYLNQLSAFNIYSGNDTESLAFLFGFFRNTLDFPGYMNLDFADIRDTLKAKGILTYHQFCGDIDTITQKIKTITNQNMTVSGVMSDIRCKEDFNLTDHQRIDEAISHLIDIDNSVQFFGSTVDNNIDELTLDVFCNWV